jgi:hypothetical protein
MANSPSNEVAKNDLPTDGFDGVEDTGIEDAEGGRPSTNRVIQGARFSFTNDYVWEIDDEEFPKDRELVVVDTVRVVQKWVNKLPAETIFVASDRKWPNIVKLNEACPKSEWGKDFNDQPQGPWQKQRITYFVDLKTMDRFTWVSGTVGADICVTEFREKVRMMRQFRGARVFAVVTLGDTFMKTRFGSRQRPDLKIQRWIMLGADGVALPAPQVKALPPASAGAQPDPVGVPVEEPDLSEQMGNDCIPW